MAERTSGAHDLLVTLCREGEVEQRAICRDGEIALRTAMVMMVTLESLEAGDKLTVEAHPRPNLIERGLA